MDREAVRGRLLSAFDNEQNDPLGAVLVVLAELNQELMLAGITEQMDPPDNQPAEREVRPEDTPIEERVWSGYDANPYYDPAGCGLELLATAAEDEAYEFHYVVLWRDLDVGDGERFFMAADSGCSCPVPFEDVRGVGDLTEVRTQGEAQQFLLSQTMSGFTPDSMASLLRAIKENLPRW